RTSKRGQARGPAPTSGKNMQYRTLGRTGLRVSEIGFGGAQVGLADYIEKWDPNGEAEQQSVVQALNCALDLGLNYVDTAAGYGNGLSEEVLGRVVGKRRAEGIVATKTGGRDPAGLTEGGEARPRRVP